MIQICWCCQEWQQSDQRWKCPEVEAAVQLPADQTGLHLLSVLRILQMQVQPVQMLMLLQTQIGLYHWSQHFAGYQKDLCFQSQMKILLDKNSLIILIIHHISLKSTCSLKLQLKVSDEAAHPRARARTHTSEQSDVQHQVTLN